MSTPQSFKSEFGGRTLTIQTGKLAQQATSSVTVQYGESVVLVTLCVAKEAREGVDFLPLTIDYEERLYAAGKIPGGFIRREGRPSTEAILAGRLTDRPIRPLLPKAWRRELQVIITVLSADQLNDPDILAIIGTSAVLANSPVPFAGPVSACRVGYINEELVLNPTMAQLEGSDLDLVVVSTKEKIVMIEAGAKEVSENVAMEALKFGHQANQSVIALQEQMRAAIGQPKETAPVFEFSPELMAAVDKAIAGRLESACFVTSKHPREDAFDKLQNEVIAQLGEQYSKADIIGYIDTQIRRIIRAGMLEKGKRVSGRGMNELRPISAEVGLLPRTHGTGLFNRGQTQVLCIATLGSTRQEQVLDGLGIEETKRFLHHYNMPPFANGEVKRINTGRREIGHGALVERALAPVIPTSVDFPYTIRLVSEVLSSNGSTSQASVCAGSLALMDAGIPVKKAVAGISIGLVTGENNRFETIVDIEGIEDNYGDMDFKVAGTKDGITAIQLDMKVKGIGFDICQNTFDKARDVRLKILEVMNGAINAPRVEVSKYAPRMYKLKIDVDKIGAVIGSGGKTIRSITEQTKTTIDIEDDGTVVIGAVDEAAAKRAIEIIEGLTRDIEVGTIYTGKVTRILAFGALVEILPGKEGMIHISELANRRVATVEEEVKVGDEVTVKVLRVEDGKIALSRKAVFEPAGGQTESGNAPQHDHRPPPRPHQGGRPPFRHNPDNRTQHQ
ncbi:MAG: polyribonucleotide nucleotidyltransferase [Dehalococcoidales bacterium]|nr:polyribonucleotide nucleotidyltransferase [Dehalococcoidales bacterium]